MPRTATARAAEPTQRPRRRAPAGKPRALRQAERREKILAAALEEFSARGIAGADGACGRARRACARRARAVSAALDGAGAGRGGVELAVRAICAARRARAPACAYRSGVRQEERRMSAGRIGAVILLAVASLVGGCDNRKEPVFQGWVEADLI